MAVKRRSTRRKTKKTRKSGKPARTVKPRNTPKDYVSKKSASIPAQVLIQAPRVDPPPVERHTITLGNIRGDTAIGDLLVSFPRTREVLVRQGLRLEADDAGDIYMTLDAFSAMNGLRTENLVREIVEVAKEPLPQAPSAQLVTPTMT
jgi:hypothetical protein